MLLLRIAAAIFEASEWLQRALTWTIIAVQAYMAYAIPQVQFSNAYALVI